MFEWKKYKIITAKFLYKTFPQDRNDLKHNIIIALAESQKRLDQDGGGNTQLSYKDMLRIASYERKKYWRSIKQINKTRSLNQIKYRGDVHGLNLIDTIPDDNIVDIKNHIIAKNLLSKMPERLITIAYKIIVGQPLSNCERNYLYHKRKNTCRH